MILASIHQRPSTGYWAQPSRLQWHTPYGVIYREIGDSCWQVYNHKGLVVYITGNPLRVEVDQRDAREITMRILDSVGPRVLLDIFPNREDRYLR